MITVKNNRISINSLFPKHSIHMDGLFPDLYILIPGNTYDFQSSQMIFLVNIKKIHVFLTTKRIRGLPENNQLHFTFLYFFNFPPH